MIVTLWKTFGPSEGTYFAKLKMANHLRLCSAAKRMSREAMKSISQQKGHQSTGI